MVAPVKEKYVSVAQLKAKLSEVLAESRLKKRRFVVLKRRKPVAVITPLEEGVSNADTPAGLAGIAGAWPGYEEIEESVRSAYESRQREGYR